MTALLALFGLATVAYAINGRWDNAALFAAFVAVTAVFAVIDRKARLRPWRGLRGRPALRPMKGVDQLVNALPAKAVDEPRPKFRLADHLGVLRVSDHPAVFTPTDGHARSLPPPTMRPGRWYRLTHAPDGTLVATATAPNTDDPAFCPDCGYRWSVHNNKVEGNRLPFGCPSETYAREAWGRE